MTRDIGIDAEIDRVRLKEQGANPSTPGSGYGFLFIKSDGLYFKGDNGVVLGPLSSYDGWIDKSGETWTRTGNHTFTISGDVTTVYKKGTKVRYKDGGSYEYGVVISSSYGAPNTTVTLATNDDYAMAATTITDNYISYIENPIGFPEWLNYTPTLSASGSMTWTSTSISHAKFAIKGKTLVCAIYATGTTGGTPSTALQATLPVAALLAASQPAGYGTTADGSGTIAGRCYIVSTNVIVGKYDASNYGTGAGRFMNIGIIYEI